MGFFGSGRQVSVSSVVYNLAGDEDKRPEYLKTLVTGKVVSNSNFSMAETIQGGYLKGPGVKLRNFVGWADRQGYSDAVGLVTSHADFGNSLNTAVLESQISRAPGETVSVQTSSIGLANFADWAAAHMSAHYPSLLESAWTADFVGGVITIHFADGTTTSFVPENFDPYARYITATYMVSKTNQVGPVVTGPTTTLPTGDVFPGVAGWDQVIFTSNQIPTVLNRVVDIHVTYSDGRAAENRHIEDTAIGSYLATHGVYSRTINEGLVDGQLVRNSQTLYQDQVGTVVAGTPVVTTVTETIAGGVTKTTQTTTTTQQIRLDRSYRTDSQRTYMSKWSPVFTYVYREGSGIAVLDAMFIAASGDKFFPFIPFRIDNEFIQTSMPDKYALAKKAFKQATGGDYDDIQKKVADNPSLKDIDYAYVVFGVSLNVKEQACRQYVYKFFKQLMLSPDASPAVYDAWKVEYQQAHASQLAYAAWAAQVITAGNNTIPPGAPEIIPYPPLPTSSLRIASDNNAVMDYNMVISWTSIQEISGTGLRSKVGDYWFESGGVVSYPTQITNEGVALPMMPITVGKVTLYHQETATTWRAMELIGLRHNNYIYGGKSVEITAEEALADDSESGFIIPLHAGIYKAMSLVDSTQMSSACCFLVFNCYKVTKKKWYQTGLFQVIIIVVIIVITIFYPPAAGLLGPSLAVGTALGFTGLTAVIVGAVANALAAMILAQLIMAGANALFGEKIGAIIGTIASVVAVSVGTAGMSGQSFTQSVSALSSARNILALTAAVGNGYAGYMNAEAQETIGEMQDYLTDVSSQLDQIQKLSDQNLTTGLDVFNPLQLTGNSMGKGYVAESSDSFLSRTLLTGSEVADLSLSLVTNFANVSLSTDLLT